MQRNTERKKMINYYRTKANDISLDESERATYANQVRLMENKAAMEEQKRRIKEQQAFDLALAELEDSGCEGGGCKI